MDDEINFLAERDVYNRVGAGGFFDLLPEYSQKNTSNMFPIIVNAVARAMMEENIVKISERDISHLLETTNNPKVKKKYFNPNAYILGYIILDGNKISKTKFELVRKKILPNLLGKIVSDIDVIRYARFWINL